MALTIDPATRRLVQRALDEDAATFDPSAAAFPPDHRSRAEVVARESMVVCGHDVFEAVFEELDESVDIERVVADGVRAGVGAPVAQLQGPTASLLRAERTALNFIQRLSGIATRTARYVDALDDPTTDVVDTRKTLPGYRHLDKYAVRCGGGRNHRFNLAGGIIVKDNHVAAAGGIREAVDRVRQKAPPTLKIEVETESIEEAERAVEAGADIVMLDNMATDVMRKAVERIRDRDADVLVEASGGITESRLPELGGIGLDMVSCGSLTHSVDAADLSMQFDD